MEQGIFIFIFLDWEPVSKRTDITKYSLDIKKKKKPLRYFFLQIFHICFNVIFHWNLSDSKPPKSSRTLLSIPADFNTAVVWIV